MYEEVITSFEENFISSYLDIGYSYVLPGQNHDCNILHWKGYVQSDASALVSAAFTDIGITVSNISILSP